MMIEVYAKRLRLPFIRNNYRDLIADARENKPDYAEFLEEILKGETMSRNENCIQKRLQLAHFPNRMILEDFQTEHLRIEIQQKVKELSTLEFIQKGENVNTYRESRDRKKCVINLSRCRSLLEQHERSIYWCIRSFD